MIKTEIVQNVKEVQDVEEQPQFTAQQLIDKSWLVQYIYRGKACVWTGSANNMGDAINKAWKEHK